MLRQSLLAGLGVTLTPHFVVSDLLAESKLVSLLPDCMPEAHEVYGITAQRRHLPLKVRAFLEFVEGELRASGYAPT
jgi:DNA-binding transcriptional LysR family regulator